MDTAVQFSACVACYWSHCSPTPVPSVLHHHCGCGGPPNPVEAAKKRTGRSETHPARSLSCFHAPPEGRRLRMCRCRWLSSLSRPPSPHEGFREKSSRLHRCPHHRFGASGWQQLRPTFRPVPPLAQGGNLLRCITLVSCTGEWRKTEHPVRAGFWAGVISCASLWNSWSVPPGLVLSLPQFQPSTHDSGLSA